MSKIRLIYYSKASMDISLDDIQQILTVARENNAKQDICGMLFYDAQWFLQALEGDEAKITALLDKINGDFRHDEMITISKESINRPIFQNWEMGYAGGKQSIASTLEKFNQEGFDPSKLTSEQCLNLLKFSSQQIAD